MKKYLFYIINTIIALGVFVSCSRSVYLKNSDITQKWVQIEGKSEFEFLKDGTVIIVEGDRSTTGSYKFIDDNLLKIDLGVKGVKVYKVTLDKRGLSLEPKGKVDMFITKAELEKLQAKREKFLKESFNFYELTAKDNKGFTWTRDGNLSKEMTWDEANKFIDKLNTEKYAGYSDWRLPRKEELVSMAKSGKIINDFFKEDALASAFNRIGFRNVQSCGYWSATTDSSNAGYIWTVSMWLGRAGNFNKSYEACVWPVRSTGR